MLIKELLKMDMGEVSDWLIENQDAYDLIKKDDDKNPTPENCYNCPHIHKPCDARQVDCPNAITNRE